MTKNKQPVNKQEENTEPNQQQTEQQSGSSGIGAAATGAAVGAVLGGRAGENVVKRTSMKGKLVKWKFTTRELTFSSYLVSSHIDV